MPDLGDGPSFLGEERPGPAKMRAMRLLLLLWLSSAPLEAQWWKVETSGIDTNLRSVSVARASNAKGASPWVVWARSEERRVGKEWRSRWAGDRERNK